MLTTISIVSIFKKKSNKYCSLNILKFIFEIKSLILLGIQQNIVCAF